MIEIDIESMKKVIVTMKGIAPANYDAMERLVMCIQYFEEMVAQAQKPKEGESNG